MQSRLPTHLAIWQEGTKWHFRAGDHESADFLSGPLDSEFFEDAVVEVVWRLQFPNDHHQMPVLRKFAELALVKKGQIGR